MRDQSWNPEGYVRLADGNKIRFNRNRSSFAGIAPACGSYTVDSYTDDEITITHDDPSLSGTYNLGNDVTILEQVLPHLITIRSLTGLSVEDTKLFGRAIWGIIQVALDDEEE